MKRSPSTFFLLVFALSIPIWLIEPHDWPITAAVLVPLPAALIMTYREEGADGVRRLLARVLDHRRITHKVWYLPIVLLWPLLALLAYLVTRLVGLPVSAEASNALLMAPLLFLLFFVLAIGEEPGWTGYATEPLLGRHSALTTGLVLGLVSSLWHLAPLINMGRSPAWIAGWALWAVPLRVLFVWIYTNTGRSLFAAVVFHAMLNLSVSSPFIPKNGSPWDLAILGVITVIATAVVTILWGPRRLTRNRRRRPGAERRLQRARAGYGARGTNVPERPREAP